MFIALVLLLAFQNARCVDAAVPPLSDKWESVAAYRNRLGLNNTYRPKNVAFHECKYLTDEECQRQDEYQANIASERSLAMANPTRKNRHLQEAPRVGDVTVLVLLIRFADHIDRKVAGQDYFDELFNGDSGSTGGGGNTTGANTVGSIKDWLYYSSMGQYKVTFDVQDWFTVDQPEAYYAKGVSGYVDAGEGQELFKGALDNLYPNYDFTKLDSGGWGNLDHLVIVHSGYGAEFGEPDDASCVVNKEQDRMWSRGYSMSEFGWQSPDFMYLVSNYVYAGAFDPGFCEEKPANMGIIAHEFMHGFGLPDLYDQDADEEGIYLGGVGRYDIMSSTWGWNRNLAIPGHMSPYSRTKVGWIQPIEITADGMYPIQASEISNQVYVIKQNFPEGEYLYIENRQPVKWDQDWPTGGIVIYHVDETAPMQTMRGYPGHANWPAEHYQVTVVQADGKFNVEKGESAGDKNDFWTLNMTLKSGGDFPNTDSYQGGNLQPTGIEITVTSESQFIMTFTVSGLGESTRTTETRGFVRSSNTKSIADTTKTGGTVAWILSMIGAVAAMLGILVLLM